MTQQLEFTIAQWSAWAPGMSTLAEWQTWFDKGEPAIDATSAPALVQIPAMKRRRLSYFAKMAVQVAVELIDARQVPTVFASRHGDLEKTSQLLLDIAQQEPLSPTQFGLSVHNAAAGQFHIYLQNFQQSNTVSAGSDSFVMGLIDAVTRLHAGDHGELLYVFAEQPMPALYQDFQQHLAMPLALGILLTKAAPANCRLRFDHDSVQVKSSREQVVDGLYGLVKQLPQRLGHSNWTLDYAENA